MKHLFSLLGLMTLLGACGAAQDVSSANGAVVTLGSVAPGSFKLYNAPNKEPNATCDVYTKLTLVNGIVAPVAILEGKVDGDCEIAVNSAQRVYSLTEQDAGCGSKLYAGSGIEIVDHRERTCRDIVEAQLIVTETVGARVQKHYTTMHRPADVAVSGQLVRKVAIGGETTGYGIQTEDGHIVEVDLTTGGFVSSFVDGQAVEVAGYTTTVAGTELSYRDVLVVTTLTLH